MEGERKSERERERERAPHATLEREGRHEKKRNKTVCVQLISPVLSPVVLAAAVHEAGAAAHDQERCKHVKHDDFPLNVQFAAVFHHLLVVTEEDEVPLLVKHHAANHTKADPEALEEWENCALFEHERNHGERKRHRGAGKLARVEVFRRGASHQITKSS